MAASKPTAFVSYARDETTTPWVKSFATHLRENGIDCKLDQWELVPGDQLAEFMDRSIRESDYVLIICTPKYKLRSDARIGGVGYEGDIMTAEVMNTKNHRKFIPILKGDDWQQSAPTWLAGKMYVDFRDGFSSFAYKELVDALYGLSEKAPPVGDGPSNFVSSAPNLSLSNEAARLDGELIGFPPPLGPITHLEAFLALWPRFARWSEYHFPGLWVRKAFGLSEETLSPGLVNNILNDNGVFDSMILGGLVEIRDYDGVIRWAEHEAKLTELGISVISECERLKLHLARRMREQRPNIALLCYAASSDCEEIRSLVKEGVAVDCRSEYADETPLFFAAVTGQVESIRELLDLGASIDARDRDGGTALGIAASHGQNNAVQVLISRGADVDLGSKWTTPLIAASSNGSLDVVKTLLSENANSELIDNLGHTAIMYAAQRGYLEIVQVLVEYGANVNYECEHGHTAQVWAQENNHFQIVKLLE